MPEEGPIGQRTGGRAEQEPTHDTFGHVAVESLVDRRVHEVHGFKELVHCPPGDYAGALERAKATRRGEEQPAYEAQIAARDGTLMVDEVDYAAPGGKLVEMLFVRKRVERIFAYRSKRLTEIFG